MRLQFVVILLAAPSWVLQRTMNPTLANAERLAIQKPVVAGSETRVGTDSRSRLAAGGLNNRAIYNRLGSKASPSASSTPASERQHV